MTIPFRTLLDTTSDQLKWMITDDGSLTLLNAKTGESYHSGCGAVAETCVVYLKNSHVLERLVSGLTTRVLEVGLGTGTGFLLTAALAESLQTRLHYVGIENNLLPADLLDQLELGQRAADYVLANEIGVPAPQQWLQEITAMHKRLGRFLRNMAPARDHHHESLLHRRQLSDWVELTLWTGPAQDFPAEGYRGVLDAIYFDPFSPATNPELWTRRVLQTMFELLAAGGRLSSYCVKGEVRRELAAVGFAVCKVPGPAGGKREVLVCHKASPPA